MGRLHGFEQPGKIPFQLIPAYRSNRGASRLFYFSTSKPSLGGCNQRRPQSQAVENPHQYWRGLVPTTCSLGVPVLSKMSHRKRALHHDSTSCCSSRNENGASTMDLRTLSCRPSEKNSNPAQETEHLVQPLYFSLLVIFPLASPMRLLACYLLFLLWCKRRLVQEILQVTSCLIELP